MKFISKDLMYKGVEFEVIFDKLSITIFAYGSILFGVNLKNILQTQEVKTWIEKNNQSKTFVVDLQNLVNKLDL